MALLCLLVTSFAAERTFAADYETIATFGSNSFIVDPAAVTAPYTQTIDGISFGPNIALGDAVGGTVPATEMPQAESKLGLIIRVAGVNPNLPFSVEIFDSSYDIVAKFAGSTLGAGTQLSFVPLVLAERFKQSATFSGLQVTWNGGEGSVEVLMHAMAVASATPTSSPTPTPTPTPTPSPTPSGTRLQALRLSLPSTVVCGSTYTLTASTSSKLPLTFSATDPSIAQLTGRRIKVLQAKPFQVTASQAGNSKWAPASKTIEVTPLKRSQTIGFSVRRKAKVGQTLNLGVTLRSDLPVNITSSDETKVRVNGRTAEVLARGRVTLTATQPGDENHLAAKAVRRTVIIR